MVWLRYFSFSSAKFSKRILASRYGAQRPLLMEEQLQTPLSELILLNLFLGSVSYLIAFSFIFLVSRANSFRWLRFVTISILSLVFGLVGSFFIWGIWSTSFDIMIGPIHIPTFLSLLIVTPILLVIFGNRLRIVKPKTIK
ncbi:hypothetical protein SAMN05661096_04106 [Marivirga sericea]|uniref:Uncharacterized protein n=1 Tax=Marivirga sericea TaxID=1028 RepID=A0A1X7LL21_9BACT|nr:hypothetical protein SAMN05661096_04106 [Marivirga sericea]